MIGPDVALLVASEFDPGWIRSVVEVGAIVFFAGGLWRDVRRLAVAVEGLTENVGDMNTRVAVLEALEEFRKRGGRT